jgi:hypothetical protein
MWQREANVAAGTVSYSATNCFCCTLEVSDELENFMRNTPIIFVIQACQSSEISVHLFIWLPVHIFPVDNNNNSMTLVLERTIPTEQPRLSAKLVPTIADRKMSRSQRAESPTAVFSISRPVSLWVGISKLLSEILYSFHSYYPSNILGKDKYSHWNENECWMMRQGRIYR